MDWSELKERLPLDAKQEAIAAAPADLRQLVLAPPGTGKTHVVVARLFHLICEQGLAPHEIAVLCFSRAAVAEITGRTTDLVEHANVHDDLRFITIRTFDSFATRLLLSCNPDLELEDDGYDQRILRAVEALEDSEGSESHTVRRIRHLIVDEIQDLVGVRARLVQVLLARINGGFTLLGDPAQAIYGWSVAEDANALTLDGLLNWLRTQTWSAKLLEPTVNFNYRSSGPSARIARELRDALIPADGDGAELFERLKNVVADLVSAGSAISPDGIAMAPTDGSLCVLCRSNGEAMQVASLLALKGIAAHTRPNPEDRGHPSWLGRVLGSYAQPTIGRSLFVERWSELVGSHKGPDVEQAWTWLKYLEGEPGQGLSARILHHRLLAGHRLPDAADAFLSTDAPSVSVSTIHASKGREFDHVVVLEPYRESAPGTSGPLEEARVLYVATTRAKESLRRLGRQGLPFLQTIDTAGRRKRWVARLHHRKMYFLEVGLRGDFDPCSSVNTWDHQDEQAARQTQERIWGSVLPGTLVSVRKEERGKKPFFKVHLGPAGEENPPALGQMSTSFLYDLKSVLRQISGNDWQLPFHMDGIRVAAVVTEVLPMYPENVHEPFATSRFCLGLRLRGMGYLWKG